MGKKNKKTKGEKSLKKNIYNHLNMISLLQITKQALDIIQPIIIKLYVEITKNKNISTLKIDNSYFTIADGLVQYLLEICLFSNKFKSIVGEEEVIVNIENNNYNVDGIDIPKKFWNEIDIIHASILSLSKSIDKSKYKNITIFIDPIDGTKEFSTGYGEQSTILVGFSKNDKAIAGIIYRPITNPITWAAGCLDESYLAGNLDKTSPNIKGFLTTNGKISTFVQRLIKNLDLERVRSGGTGNKLLMLLEGKGICYIQDRGVSRWDTCAPQAVLEAYGGILSKLSPFIRGEGFKQYKYRYTKINLDFEPGLSTLTRYNAKNTLSVKESILIKNVKLVKPYSNLCGLLALTPYSINWFIMDSYFFESFLSAKIFSTPIFS